MYKKILVALENSKSDEYLLDHIATLASQLGSELLLLHVAEGFAARNFDQLKLAASDEMKEDQAYLDYGRFPIERDGVVATLEVYRPVEHPDQFFIAFFDSSNGGETYEGGRYVHLDSLDTHRFVLDFNKAYNPYCAYDSSWICPIPPRANALPFAVRAGMMGVPHP